MSPSELLRRTLRPHRQNRTHRPHPDLRRTPPAACVPSQLTAQTRCRQRFGLVTANVIVPGTSVPDGAGFQLDHPPPPFRGVAPSICPSSITPALASILTTAQPETRGQPLHSSSGTRQDRGLGWSA